MRFKISVLFFILLVGMLPAISVRADGDPPYNPLQQPRPQSPYGMDLMGPAWQWTYPRETAHSRLDGSIRVDLLDEMFRESWAAGVRHARISVWWCMTEPERDAYRWQDLDAAFQIASNYGMEIVPQIFYTPDWAALGHDVDTPCFAPEYRNLPPQNMDDWSDFMAALTKRYGAYGKNQVHNWEMWNEPDLYEFWYIPWDPENANVPMYARLIKRARAEIDRYDPGGRLLAGGVSDINGPAFLQRLIELEGEDDVKEDIDVITFHVFSQPERRLEALKAALGGRDFTLWVTELNSSGWTETVPLEKLAALYDLMASEDISRTFWFKSWTSDWGPGIFDGSVPIWQRESFDHSPFYPTFQKQTLSHAPPAPPMLEQPAESDLTPPRPEFSWQRPPAGDLPIVGYKLQVDDSLYRGQPHFHSPELDVWVPATLVHFLPLQMTGGGAAASSQSSVAAAPPTISEISYRPELPLPPGHYYWRVAAVDSQGNVGTYSDVRSIFVTVGDARVFLPSLVLP